MAAPREVPVSNSGSATFSRAEKLRDQLAVLENETEALEPQVRTLPIPQRGEFLPVEEDLAIVGCEDAGQAMQQRRLSGTGGAHDGHGLALPDRQRNAGEGLDRPEAQGDVVGNEPLLLIVGWVCVVHESIPVPGRRFSHSPSANSRVEPALPFLSTVRSRVTV